jgi:hypothetical protein
MYVLCDLQYHHQYAKPRTLSWLLLVLDRNFRFHKRRILYTSIVRLCMSLLALYIHYKAIVYSFLAGKSVLVILCLGRPFCIFERCLKSTRTQRAAEASRRATNLASSHPSLNFLLIGIYYIAMVLSTGRYSMQVLKEGSLLSSYPGDN